MKISKFKAAFALAALVLVPALAIGQEVSPPAAPTATSDAPKPAPAASEPLSAQTTPQDKPKQASEITSISLLKIGSKTYQIKGTVTNETLPDGRRAIIFSDPTDMPKDVEGFEPTTLPDGRVALIKIPFARPLLPEGTQSFIRVKDKAIINQTGIVDDKTDIATIPFSYLKTVKLKSDVLFYFPFRKPKIDIPAGVVGFYGGTFKVSNFIHPARTVCFFENSGINYAKPRCFLKPYDNLGQLVNPVRNIETYSNVPLFFPIRYTNYIESISMTERLDLEDGEFDIPHDFKLSLKFKIWEKGELLLKWYSDGKFVKDEFLNPDSNGQYSLVYTDGTLIFKPVEGDKKKAMVEFIPKP